jgi:hypothetical protein
MNGRRIDIPPAASGASSPPATSSDGPPSSAPTGGARLPTLVMRTHPSRAVVIALSALALIHVAIASPGLVARPPRGGMSLAFGTAFALLAVACQTWRVEYRVLPAKRLLRVSAGFGPVSVRRNIPFRRIRGVRLTVSDTGRHASESHVDLLCDREELRCPSTPLPRQQALCLAILMRVPLTKILGDSTVTPPPATSAVAERLDRLNA